MSRAKYGNLEINLDRLNLLIGGRSQKDFAQWIDESPSTVTEWIKGRNKPGWNFLMKLAINGVNVNWFLTGEGEMYVKQTFAGAPPANVQTLLYEIKNHPEIVDELVKLARSAKNVQAVYGMVAEAVAKYKTDAEALSDKKKLKK